MMAASYDWTPVQLSYDKTSYNPGDVITVTVSGQVKKTEGGSVTDNEVLSQTLTSADGSMVTIQSQQVSVTKTAPGGGTVTNLPVTITSVTGSGRTWTVAPNGLTATAVA